jgi:hypothetical protein
MSSEYMHYSDGEVVECPASPVLPVARDTAFSRRVSFGLSRRAPISGTSMNSGTTSTIANTSIAPDQSGGLKEGAPESPQRRRLRFEAADAFDRPSALATPPRVGLKRKHSALSEAPTAANLGRGSVVSVETITASCQQVAVEMITAAREQMLAVMVADWQALAENHMESIGRTLTDSADKGVGGDPLDLADLEVALIYDAEQAKELYALADEIIAHYA